MKFNKLIAVAALTFASAVACASDRITIIHTGGKTGFTAVLAKQYSDAFAESYKNIEVIAPGGCIPVLSHLKNNTKDPIVVMWDTGNIPAECKAEFSKQNAASTMSVYFALVTNNKNATIEDFIKGKGKIGIAPPFKFWTGFVNDIERSTGNKFEGILPVGDSGKQVLSLKSGEVDWVFLNGSRAYEQVEAGNFKAVASTDPKGQGDIPFVGARIKNFGTDVFLGWGVYITNLDTADRAKFEETIRKLHETKNWKEFTKKFYLVDSTLNSPTKRNEIYRSNMNAMSTKD